MASTSGRAQPKVIDFGIAKATDTPRPDPLKSV
jgi:hypothetical protein